MLNVAPSVCYMWHQVYAICGNKCMLYVATSVCYMWQHRSAEGHVCVLAELCAVFRRNAIYTLLHSPRIIECHTLHW